MAFADGWFGRHREGRCGRSPMFWLCNPFGCFAAPLRHPCGGLALRGSGVHAKTGGGVFNRHCPQIFGASTKIGCGAAGSVVEVTGQPFEGVVDLAGVEMVGYVGQPDVFEVGGLSGGDVLGAEARLESIDLVGAGCGVVRA
jgi:hypothetical protein